MAGGGCGMTGVEMEWMLKAVVRGGGVGIV